MKIDLLGVSEFKESYIKRDGTKVERNVLQCLDADSVRGRLSFYDLSLEDETFKDEKLTGKTFTVQVSGVQQVFAGHVRLNDAVLVEIKHG